MQVNLPKPAILIVEIEQHGCSFLFQSLDLRLRRNLRRVVVVLDTCHAGSAASHSSHESRAVPAASEKKSK